ncbi:uncharacterized protein [Antedon mediterranea]|uniref:uncharacterized protein n=1 Tax=Antedon mediterranea TaxID=105859 RepID=UPI003AF7E8EF
MAERRAKYEVTQMLRYLSDDIPVSPRTSPRSPDLSRSDEVLREKYNELNNLMLSHIAQRKTLGHLYSSYDLDFKKVSPENRKTKLNKKEIRTLKGRAKRLTEFNDYDSKVSLKVWEIPSDSEPDDRDLGETSELCDDVSEHTYNSTINSSVTIHEVNSEGEEINSDYEKNSYPKSKQVSFVENKNLKDDPIPNFDPNSLETLILKDILRHQRSKPKHTDSGISLKTKTGKNQCRSNHRKGSPRKKKSKTDPPEKSPRIKTKSALDNHFLSSSNADVKRWVREKNKLARKKLKEERKKEREEMEKEHNADTERTAKMIESEEKVKTWVKEKHKQVLLQRKLKQRVEEIQRHSTAETSEESVPRNSQIKEQFELRKTAIKRRQRRIRNRKEEETNSDKAGGNEKAFPKPASARLIHDEKLQAKAAKKKYGVSVRGTLDRAAKQMQKEEQMNQDTNDLNNNVKKPIGRTSQIKNIDKKMKPKEKNNNSCSTPDNNKSTDDVDHIHHVRKTNRMTYNAWINIKLEGDKKKKQKELTKKVDLDLERLLPTLSQERIRRATDSKKSTMAPERDFRNKTNSSSRNHRNEPENVFSQRPKSTMTTSKDNPDYLPKRPASAKTNKSVLSHNSLKNELNEVLEGERPEPQGCELPDNSPCHDRTKATRQLLLTDDRKISTHPPSTDLDILNTESVFITASN